MAQRYNCTLSSEALEKANKELNEPDNNKDRLKAIDDLRCEFKTKNPDIKLIREDDKFLLKFLRSTRFQISKATEVLKNFHLLKTECPEVCDKIKNPEQLDEILCQGVVCPLQGRAKNGAAIIVVRPGLQFYAKPFDFIAAVWKILNILLEDEQTQIYGIAIIVDVSISNSDSVLSIENPFDKMTTLNHIIITLFTAIPLKIETVHYINQPADFQQYCRLLVPCFDKLENIFFYFHGDNFCVLHNMIDESVLPKMFEGSGPEMDVEGWKQRVISDTLSI